MTATRNRVFSLIAFGLKMSCFPLQEISKNILSLALCTRPAIECRVFYAIIPVRALTISAFVLEYCCCH